MQRRLRQWRALERAVQQWYCSWSVESLTIIYAVERSNLALCDKWHQCKVSCTLDSNAKLALLAWVEPCFGAWFDLSVWVYKTEQCLWVFVVKVTWNVFLKSSCHDDGSFQYLYSFRVHSLCAFRGKTVASSESYETYVERETQSFNEERCMKYVPD